MNTDIDSQESDDVKPLPNFIPPEARNLPEIPEDALAMEEITQEEAEPDPQSEEPFVDPQVASEPDDYAYGDDLIDLDPLQNPDQVVIDRATYEALMSAARSVQAAEREVRLDPEELQRSNAAVHTPVQGQQLRTGTEALAEGGMSLLGGAAALTGAALQAGGRVASSLAGMLRDREQESSAVGVAVLPRISEYRVDQAEKAAIAYENAMKKLWTSGALPSIRKEIEERARQTGVSVEDVLEKMKPNGEMSDLHEKFRSAVAESFDAQTQKKAMDKALDGWVKQYGRGQEELLNPETDGNPHFEALRKRLDNSHDKMRKNASSSPVFDGEEKSHIEKLNETVQRIMEKLKEIAKDFFNMVTGKDRNNSRNDDGPSL